MKKLSTITISIRAEALEALRDEALANYRSISKQIALIIDNHIKAQKEGKN
jgi:hypothetical protein